MQSIRSSWADNLKVIKGCWKATVFSISNRFVSEFFQFLPSISFFVMQAVTVFSLFHVINHVEIPVVDLLIFIGIMICVDGCGDAIFLAGIHEYCTSLVRGQTVYFLLTPGTPLLKIFFFRTDTTKFAFCALAGLGAIGLSVVERDSNPFLVLLVLLTGVLTHMILTSAFHIIQAYWDPTRPIRLGSPATRFYTRPIHLVLRSLPIQIILVLIYPAYFATAFPTIIATNIVPPEFPFSLGTAFVLGVGVLLLWAVGLNHLIKKSCVKYQN
ncbi:hypothetical protein [Tumebacillus permanentifrigoris]|uniref:Uncharacterized protein n=1 Tax=Tumebacillus permanentifrigoris TaxID=378543 RepID=A0A316D4P6_9BACL|nr:hypothetical protein [Tumebacillus permanentifrigoris]PWK07889.1 hypothetical protein C7459_11648 [Tumebacillus permanentifrigoris]